MLDVAISSLSERFDLLSSHSEGFKFLWNISDFNKYSEQEQLNLCQKLEEALTDKNQSDINSIELMHELQFLQSFGENVASPDSQAETLSYIVVNNLTHSFPNIYIPLHITLTIPVSVATAERSFSKLKIIQNYLRSTMGQERLANLEIISIESDILQKIDIDLLINQFAKNKAQKVQFL